MTCPREASILIFKHYWFYYINAAISWHCELRGSCLISSSVPKIPEREKICCYAILTEHSFIYKLELKHLVVLCKRLSV